MNLHILFIAPETHVYNHEFVRGLKETGALVSAIGHAPRERLAPDLKRNLDGFATVKSLFDPDEVLRAARSLAANRPLDRVETIDEPLVVPAAQLREAMGLPGLSVQTATLCRDKSAMKDFLRAQGVPCAQSFPASTNAEVERFVEQVGLPVILKPRAGFGSLNTHRARDRQELEQAMKAMRLGEPGASILVEEFVDGHEGFYDTITINGEIALDFVSHYYPGCLAALEDRRVSPQIVHTNRIDSDGYAELRTLGARVNRLLGLDRSATHMEWFFGTKGLKFSEIGARPAGEKIWDLYRVANETDIYREWAGAIVSGKTESRLSRKFATGSIQIRPDRDGRYVGHEGLEEMRRRFGNWVYEANIPAAGSPTQPLEKGWLVNTWFRLRHSDYDTLREMMNFIAGHVRALAR